jgi:hypothetical protein
MSNELIVAFGGPVLTAVLAALGVWFQEWREQRNDLARQRRTRIEAAEMVAFLDKWLALQQRVCSEQEYAEVQRRARSDLEQLYAELSLQRTQLQPSRARDALSFVKRALLLYRPARPIGWLVRALFYFMAIVILLFSFGSLVPADQGPIQWGTVLGGYILLLVPLLALRSLAVALDGPRSPQAAYGGQPDS